MQQKYDLIAMANCAEFVYSKEKGILSELKVVVIHRMYVWCCQIFTRVIGLVAL